MFHVYLPYLEVKIEGCPESGVAAVDFRRQNGLPESPSDVIAIPLDLQSEAIVRAFPQFADSSADIKYPNNPRYGNSHFYNEDCVIGTSTEKGGFLTRHVICPATIAAALATDGGKHALLAEIAEDRAGRKLKAELAAATAELAKAKAVETENRRREISDAVSALSDLDDDGILGASCPLLCRYSNEPWHKYPIREAEALAVRRAAIVAARKQADDDAAAAKVAAAMAERDAWIDAHGSDHLRRMRAEGIGHTQTYLGERLAVDRPGWQFIGMARGKESPPVEDVPAEAFAVLDAARVTAPKAKLIRWAEDGMYRFAARSSFLGRKIVFFGSWVSGGKVSDLRTLIDAGDLPEACASVEVTRKMARDAGMCDSGIDVFSEKHLGGRTTATVGELLGLIDVGADRSRLIDLIVFVLTGAGF